MKYPIAVLALALLVFGPLACGKDNISINYALLRHKWNIVSITGEAYGYHGQTGDYFDFRADNKLYRHSAGNFDTLAYILVNGWDGIYWTSTSCRLPPVSCISARGPRFVF